MRLMRFNATAEHAPGKTLALADAEDTLRTHTVLRHKKVVKRLFKKMVDLLRIYVSEYALCCLQKYEQEEWLFSHHWG